MIIGFSIKENMKNSFKSKPKKSLGQNFLRDESVVGRIVDEAGVGSEDCVLEIGPGQGVLTKELSKKAKKVVAVELDDDLIDGLKEKFKDNENVTILHQDILKVDLGELSGQNGLACGDYRVIANIPYYITAKIIRFFLESNCPPRDMVLMVQKEVAQRIVAKPGDMSLLAVSVQYYARADILFEVDRECFDPIPEVDSAIIQIGDIKSNFDLQESRDFFRVVRAGFCAKRKTLLNNLSNSLHLEKDVVASILKDNGFDSNTRAQELSVDDWKKIIVPFKNLLEK